MSVEAILIAALCVAVPVTLKYILSFELSFEIGQQMAMLKAGEREVTGLSNRLAALKQEHGIVRRACLPGAQPAAVGRHQTGSHGGGVGTVARDRLQQRKWKVLRAERIGIRTE